MMDLGYSMCQIPLAPLCGSVHHRLSCHSLFLVLFFLVLPTSIRIMMSASVAVSLLKLKISEDDVDAKRKPPKHCMKL